MTQFRLDSDIEIGLSVGVTRARVSIVGDNADKVLEEFAQLFTRDYVQPVSAEEIANAEWMIESLKPEFDTVWDDGYAD